MPEHEFTVAEIANVDQYLASLDEVVRGPLENLRKIIAQHNGDTALAYASVGRGICRGLEDGGTDYRVAVGLGYAAMLILLNRKAAK